MMSATERGEGGGQGRRPPPASSPMGGVRGAGLPRSATGWGSGAPASPAAPWRVGVGVRGAGLPRGTTLCCLPPAHPAASGLRAEQQRDLSPEQGKSLSQPCAPSTRGHLRMCHPPSSPPQVPREGSWHGQAGASLARGRPPGSQDLAPSGSRCPGLRALLWGMAHLWGICRVGWSPITLGGLQSSRASAIWKGGRVDAGPRPGGQQSRTQMRSPDPGSCSGSAGTRGFLR